MNHEKKKKKNQQVFMTHRCRKQVLIPMSLSYYKKVQHLEVSATSASAFS